MSRQRDFSRSGGGILAGVVIGGMCGGPVGAVLGGAVGCVVGSAPNTAVSPQRSVAMSSQNTRGVLRALQRADGVSAAPALPVSVTIPREAMQHRGATLFFTVVVQPLDGGAPWTVSKRYNDFYYLNAFLRGAKPHNWDLTACATHLNPNAIFPRKHITGCEGWKLENRRAKLEAWLMRVVCQSHVQWQRPVQAFLECNRYQPPLQVATMPVSAGPDAIPLAAPATPSAGVYLPAVPQAAKEARPPLPNQQQGETMEIQIPNGVQAGEVIGVTVPDGRQATITVPQGMASGSSLLLWFEPVSGTLFTLDRSQPHPAQQPLSQAPPSQAPPSQTPAGQIITVQVPAGVPAGQLLGVVVPDGRQINVAVPHGAFEGSTVQLWFDPAAGTLTNMC